MLDQLATSKRPAAARPSRTRSKLGRTRRIRADLAAAVGLDKAYLSKVERGLKVPSIATPLKLAKALEIPVSQLFGESVDESVIHVSRGAAAQGLSARTARIIAPSSPPTARAARGSKDFVFLPPDEFLEDMRAEHGGEELLNEHRGRSRLSLRTALIALDESDFRSKYPWSPPAPGFRRTTPEASVLSSHHTFLTVRRSARSGRGPHARLIEIFASPPVRTHRSERLRAPDHRVTRIDRIDRIASGAHVLQTEINTDRPISIAGRISSGASFAGNDPHLNRQQPS